MAKRIFTLFCVFVLLISFFLFPAHAAEHQETILYYEDGSYLVTTITESVSRSHGTKTGSKDDRYFDVNGNLQWQITVTGTFTYTGTTSTCIYAGGTTSIANTDRFKLVSDTHTQTGSVATYTAVLGKKALGIVVSKETHSISLTCDKDGNLS